MDAWLTALWSALFAGLVAVGVTVAIERWGGVVGGVLGTVPTTIIPAAVGIHATAADETAYVAAVTIMPTAIILNVLFLLMWRIIPPHLPEMALERRLGLMVLLSLGMWLIGAILLVLALDALDAGNTFGIVLGALATLALLVMGVLASRRQRPAPRANRRVGWATLVARGVLAGAAIGAAVLISEAGSALAAGVATVFPAIFLTTMVGLWVSQGEAVPGGAVGPMMLGATSVAAYGLIVAWSLPAYGAGLGSVVAWVLSVGTISLPAGWWLHRRQQRWLAASAATTLGLAENA